MVGRARRLPPLAAAVELRLEQLVDGVVQLLANHSAAPVLGLATRVATLPFLGMIAVIQTLVYPQAWVEHLTWVSILMFLLTRGPGAISVDYPCRAARRSVVGRPAATGSE